MPCLARMHVAVVLILALPAAIQARHGQPPPSRSHTAAPVESLDILALPAVDAAALVAEDAAIKKPAPLRYAQAHKLDVTPATHGTWEEAGDGAWLWRLRVYAPNATDLNFGFTRLLLPAGATLHIVSESDDYYEGPYTDRDNEPHGELWTPVVPGDRAVIELYLPSTVESTPELALSQVGLGYRDMFRRRSGVAPKAGSCNNDVICPVGDPWRNDIRSVARISIGGSSLCSGTLIMDVPRDFRGFFLTANHCGLSAGNAASTVVYWNFESPTCGQLSGGSLADNQTGATFRSAKADVDFALIELDDMPDPSFQVYYAGWDRSGAMPQGSVCIHHPNTDEKAISFNDDPLTTINSCIGSGTLTHWRVNDWEDGTTEPGSSGSGLWDPDTHFLVGTLSGGTAACPDLNGFDCFGKFASGWDSGSSAADRLKDWLDPQDQGDMTVSGADPMPVPRIVAHDRTLVSENCKPANQTIDPGEMVTVDLAIRNVGTANTSNLVATLLATGGVSHPSEPQTCGALIAGGPPVTESFSFTANGICGETVTVTLQLQDGSNSLGTVNFTFLLGVVGGTTVTSVYSSGGITVPLPDLGTAESTMLVPDSGAVSDVNVSIRLNHTYDRDLMISLVHPDGTSVLLANGRGSSGDNFGSGANDCTGTFTVFDDSAATPISSGTAPFNGTFQPDGPLSAFNSKPSAGTWTLRIQDMEAADVGTLFCWEIEVQRQQFICCGSESCAIDCPPYQVRNSASNQCGKTVTYPAPTTSGSCGPVECTPPSGSFFPIGSSIVTCTEVGTAHQCSFNILMRERPLPVVSLTVRDADASEPGVNTGRFRVVRVGCTNAPLRVNYSIGGTATSGIDYHSISGAVTIPAGKIIANIIVRPLDDAQSESVETVRVKLKNSLHYQIGASSNATVNIRSDE